MNNFSLENLHQFNSDQSIGIYSVCSANGFVLKAAMRQAMEDETNLLVESTSNQVNQMGGYIGMTPSQFVDYVHEIARTVSFPLNRLILGGDHLGPNPWQNENANSAMEKSKHMIRDYVQAGYQKIHLDASMKCNDDNGPLHEPLDCHIIAERAADLCEVAEQTYQNMPPGSLQPLYVIGTDVPIPGGAVEEQDIEITNTVDIKNTIEITKKAFLTRGLDSAWKRVIAVVVQPGVEFGDEIVLNYSHDQAKELSLFIENYSNLVYEAHSTDYQLKSALRQMVKDHFAILKVGPWLTFAFREAVFALAEIEEELSFSRKGIVLSHIRETLDQLMCENPTYWNNHYKGDHKTRSFSRKYSYSDRSRYYWNLPHIRESLSILIHNLNHHEIPATLLSQYLPMQYQSIREGRIQNSPEEIIQDKIRDTIVIYSYACGYC